jgi:hypothetical protein
MKLSGWLALAVLISVPLSAHAHNVFGLGPGVGGAAGSGFSVRFHSPHVSFSATRLTVFPVFGGSFFRPPVYAVPVYAGYGPWFGPPYLWGGSPFFNGFNPYGFSGMSPIILPPMAVPALPAEPGVVNPPPAPAPRVPGPQPGQVAGRFRPVGPLDRERARDPIRAEAVPIPRPAPRVPNPLAEHDELLQAGRRAFAAGEYGRAGELFRLAITTAPELASAYFLLAQVELALGKYPDAAATIHRGLARQEDWRTTGPALRDLYAGNLGAFAEHKRRLDAAANDRPGDAALDFLRAYVGWFDGRRDEARALFRQVRERVIKPEVIDRFLQAPAA